MQKISIKREQSQAGLSFAEREKFRPQVKDSMKREQSQAGLSFAERKNRRSLAGGESNFRPQVKNKFLLLLALLMTAATGAWGMQIYISYPSWPTGTNVNGDGNLVLEMEASDSFENMKAKIEDKSGLNPDYMKLYFNSVEMANNETLNAKGVTSNSVLTLVYAPYSVTMKSDVKDADKWTVKVGEGQAQALPIGGLNEGETVTLQYNGRLKVKGVKATSDAGAPAAASLIVNPAVGQVIGADGKNYADAAAATAAGTTAVAKICYVGSDNGEAAPYNHGLALALSDANDGTPCTWNESFTDAGHTKQNDCNNFTSESGLQYNDTHNSDAYPAFQAAIANNGTAAPTGCSSWFLPSGYQWKKMIDAVGGHTNLGLTVAYYWSSSENDADHAWDLECDQGIWCNSNKSFGDQVRACLAF